MKNRILIVLWLALAVSFGTVEARANASLSAQVDSREETLTLTSDRLVPQKVFLLPEPDRLVVDIPVQSGKSDLHLPADYHGTVIKKLRSGLFNPQTLRLVFELNQTPKVDKQVEGDKLIIHLMPKAPEQPAPVAKQEKEEATIPPPPEPPVLRAPEKHPMPPLTQLVPKVVIKKQKKPGDAKKPEKPVIVIDPGHGGQDPGTSGPDGTDEKDVVLAYAKLLKARLLKTGQYQVVLTRDDDIFIPLRQRVTIARKAQANMFISLHADSAPDMAARGLSVYTVSEQSSDKEAAALAARENKADILAGMDLSDESQDVAGILISLAERETKNRSATLADILVTSLDDKVHLLPNSHRFAGFAVLKAPDVPSVLIEIGFLSHPNEEKLLQSNGYKDRVVGGIVSGINVYFDVQKRLTNG